MQKLNKDELFTLAMQLDLQSLLSFCLCSKYIQKNLYLRDEIWIYKLKKDFPDYKKLKVEKSFKEIYKILFSLTKLKNKIKIKGNIYDLYNFKILHLSDKSLIEIPKEICYLTNLKTLYLHNKSTAIPKEIYNLPNLKIIRCINESPK